MDKLLINGRLRENAGVQLACLVNNYLSRALPLPPGSKGRRLSPYVHAEDRVLFVNGHVWDELRNDWNASRHMSVGKEGYYFAGVPVIVLDSHLIQEWKLGTIDNLGATI